MLSKFWQYAAGGFAALAGILGALLLIAGNQRDRAREAAKVATAKAQGIEKVREVEHSIDDAKAVARERAKEIEREQNNAKASGTRPRVFGDPRMHDDPSSPDQS